ncbi:helix-turn-helix domain-containing protein [Microbacterium oleivorans]|uniref:Helix-turn-helix transcriptional regulator n=1 Tax=Microbacterium oleivorans TaxID=273677 RepID=A0A7D5EX38_9MICO|nr:helix-turn-helix transcriptional regulator [Microbacterium oleivorans]QLD10968.1 helix-turn-helix transcriptional regulator [Microbacterium oleivorans]
MPILVDIDRLMDERGMTVAELSALIGITPANLAVLKNGRAKAVRFSTLSALCEALDCQPGDILRYDNAPAESEDPARASATIAR